VFGETLDEALDEALGDALGEALPRPFAGDSPDTSVIARTIST
jgi:hypothetical protein